MAHGLGEKKICDHAMAAGFRERVTREIVLGSIDSYNTGEYAMSVRVRKRLKQ